MSETCKTCGEYLDEMGDCLYCLIPKSELAPATGSASGNDVYKRCAEMMQACAKLLQEAEALGISNISNMKRILFVEVPVLHPNNVEGDTTAHIQIDAIMEIRDITPMEKRQRSEAMCCIQYHNMHGLLVGISRKELLERIEEVQKEFPSSE